MIYKKLTTVDIKSLTRAELEEAYKILLMISLQKTELIKNQQEKYYDLENCNKVPRMPRSVRKF